MFVKHCSLFVCCIFSGESEPTSTAGDGGGDVDDGDCSSKKNGVSETNDFGSVPLTVPEEGLLLLTLLILFIIIYEFLSRITSSVLKVNCYQ